MHYLAGAWDFLVSGRQNGQADAKRSMSSFAALRIKKQNQWTFQLQSQLEAVVQQRKLTAGLFDEGWRRDILAPVQEQIEELLKS